MKVVAKISENAEHIRMNDLRLGEYGVIVDKSMPDLMGMVVFCSYFDEAHSGTTVTQYRGLDSTIYCDWEGGCDIEVVRVTANDLTFVD